MITKSGKVTEWTCWHCGLGVVYDSKYGGLFRRVIAEREEDGARVVCPFCGRVSREDAALVPEEWYGDSEKPEDDR